MNEQNLVKAPSLNKGDLIGIMAPSCSLDRHYRAQFYTAVNMLQDAGYGVRVHIQSFSKRKSDPDSAGTENEKIEALHDLWRDPEVKAIFAARGGYGSKKLLSRLDYGLMRYNPKILMGFSDTTALLNAVSQTAGLVTFHGPATVSFAEAAMRPYLANCFNMLAGRDNTLDMERSEVLFPGQTAGKLVGGNLATFAAMARRLDRDYLKGSIMFFEEWKESIPTCARLLRDLKNAKILTQASALVFGSFSHLKSRSSSYDRQSALRAAIHRETSDLDVPVVINAPFGHARKLMTLPVGADAFLFALSQRAPALVLQDSPVRSIG